jgi:hypothetical protein
VPGATGKYPKPPQVAIHTAGPRTRSGNVFLGLGSGRERRILFVILGYRNPVSL